MREPVYYFEELFMQNYWFFNGWNPKDVKKLMTKRFKEDFDVEFYGDGKTILYKHPSRSPLILLWCRHKNDYSVISHEADHAANFCLDMVGVKASFKNDETHAYLVGLLVKKMIKK